ncbi:MAG: hypothetical protein ACE15F_24305 [bacterium]
MNTKPWRGFACFLFFGLQPLVSPALEITYRVSLPEPASHYLYVQIDLDGLEQDVLDLQLPAWSPGLYLILDFARMVSGFSAESPSGPLPHEKTDKHTWRVTSRGASRITARYRVFANILNGAYSQVNEFHAFLAGSSLYMYPVGHKDQPVLLEVEVPPGWRILSSTGGLGQTRFRFPNYDLLIDELVQLGEFFMESFLSGDTEYRVCILKTNADAPLIPDFVQKIRAMQATTQAMLGPLDTPRYTFFFHFRPDASNSVGMEHFNGCQLTRRHLLSDTGAAMDLTLWVTAHELAHAWNVKRLRPQGLGPFDYSREAYTSLLWFAEGVSNYLADMIMVRCGLWTRQQLYTRLASNISTFRFSPGIHERSPESASFDTWLTPVNLAANQSDWSKTWVSYYLSGELLGLCIDLEIRQRTANQKTFEDFFHLLYQRQYSNTAADSYYAPGRGFTTADVLQALSDTTGSDWHNFYTEWIATTGDIPFETYLAYAGLILRPQAPSPAAALPAAPISWDLFWEEQWPIPVPPLEVLSPADKAGRPADLLARGQMVVLQDTVFVPYEIVESPDPSPLARQIREDWLKPVPDASTRVPDAELH